MSANEYFFTIHPILVYCFYFTTYCHIRELRFSYDFLSKNKDFYKKICTDPRGYAWNEKENISPDTTYFNGMALRAARAAQFLTTLPEWNKKELCSAGGSQGGLQALWCAWLAPEAVTRVAVEKPWCCFLEGPRRGFYSAGLTLKPLPGVLYFDPTNFVSQISCPINIYYAGLGDYMCPPSGLAVLSIVLLKGKLHFTKAEHMEVPPKIHKVSP